MLQSACTFIVNSRKRAKKNLNYLECVSKSHRGSSVAGSVRRGHVQQGPPRTRAVHHSHMKWLQHLPTTARIKDSAPCSQHDCRTEPRQFNIACAPVDGCKITRQLYCHTGSFHVKKPCGAGRSCVVVCSSTSVRQTGHGFTMAFISFCCASLMAEAAAVAQLAAIVPTGRRASEGGDCTHIGALSKRMICRRFKAYNILYNFDWHRKRRRDPNPVFHDINLPFAP